MPLILDVECYRDYFLIAFLNSENHKVATFEMFAGKPLNVSRVAHFMNNHTTMSFNGNGYDLFMIEAALQNRSCGELKNLSDEIIKSNLPSWKIAREFDVSPPQRWDHIDIMGVIPGQAGLKVYAGRIGYKKLQELPIEPDASISPEQRELLKEYCTNDVRVTEALYRKVEKQIALRVDMGKKYDVDLRSKSDAQIAEAVLKHEIEKVSGKTLQPPRVKDGATYRYLDPKIINFKGYELRKVFNSLTKHDFELAPNGSIKMPDWLKETKITIGDTQYQMGIGGLHSCEKGQSVIAGDDHILADFDVASYYPSIILQQRIAPDSMGDSFIQVYRSIVDGRIKAKRRAGVLGERLGRLKKELVEAENYWQNN